MNIKRFNAKLSLLENLIEHSDVSITNISTWTIGEHIEHTLKVNEEIFKLILNCPEILIQKGSSISFIGRIVLLTKFIPQGKGKAPPHTQPVGISPESLLEKVEEVRKLLEQVHTRLEEMRQDKRSFGKHPYFGAMTRIQWLIFASVHQRHHLKIIEQIMRQADFSQKTKK